MWIEQLVFYAFALIAVLAGLLVITLRNPVSSALFLVLAFFATSVLWILLEAEFLALVLIFVYVGAVMTLFLFVVMMINLNRQYLKGGFVKFLPVAGVIVAGMVALMLYVISPERFTLSEIPARQDADFSNIQQLGLALYTEHAYPFELAAVLLLIAIVSAISLCHIQKKKRKAQDIAKQLQVDKQKSIEIIAMKPEKKR